MGSKIAALIVTLVWLVVPGACSASPLHRSTPEQPCRLPVGSFQRGVGGFFHYPDAGFTSDEASGLTYIAPRRSWVDSPRTSYSPDGEELMRFDGPRAPHPLIHIEDSTTFKEVRSFSDPGNGYPLGWTANGIAVLGAAPQSATAPASGLAIYVVNPTDGAQELAIPDSTPSIFISGQRLLEHDALWTMPTPQQLVRISLSDGSHETWYQTKASESLNLIGTGPDGVLLVEILTQTSRDSRYVALTRPLAAVEVSTAGLGLSGHPQAGVADSHGLWFIGGFGRIFLFQRGEIRYVGSVPSSVAPTGPSGPLLQSTAFFRPGGPCLPET